MLGDEVDTSGARHRHGKLWNEEHGTYLDFDLVAGRPIRVYGRPNLVPLYAGVPGKGRGASHGEDA